MSSRSDDATEKMGKDAEVMQREKMGNDAEDVEKEELDWKVGTLFCRPKRMGYERMNLVGTWVVTL